jgi:hypothetical protein
MPSQPSRRRRREQLEAMLAGGQARLERARSRSLVVDTMVGVVRREHPVAVGILAAAAVLEVLRWVHLLAWRMSPVRGRTNPWLVLGLVAGLTVMAATSAGAEQARADTQGLAGQLTVVLVGAAVQVTVTAVLWLALSLALPRPAAVPWTALVPGACLFGAGLQGFSLAVSLYFAPRAARASTVYGSLGVALVLPVSLFLFARLAVAAAELNATLWERRHPPGPPTEAGSRPRPSSGSTSFQYCRNRLLGRGRSRRQVCPGSGPAHITLGG